MFKFYPVCLLMTMLFCVTATAGKKEAIQAFKEGNDHFAANEFEEAALSFRRAYELKPSWKLLFNIAQAEAAAKRYGVALETFEQYLAKAGDEITSERADEVFSEVTRLRQLVGVLDVQAPKGTILLIDEMERGQVPFGGPIRVSVGPHKATLLLDGETILEQRINIAGNMTTDLAYTPESAAPENEPPSAVEDRTNEGEPAGKGLLVGGIISSVLAAGGIGVGTVFTVKFSDDNDAWKEAAEDYEQSGSTADYNDTRDFYDDAKRDSTLLKVGYIAGGALAVTAVVLFALHAKKKNEKLSFLPTPGGLLISF